MSLEEVAGVLGFIGGLALTSAAVVSPIIGAWFCYFADHLDRKDFSEEGRNERPGFLKYLSSSYRMHVALLTLRLEKADQIGGSYPWNWRSQVENLWNERIDSEAA